MSVKTKLTEFIVLHSSFFPVHAKFLLMKDPFDKMAL